MTINNKNRINLNNNSPSILHLCNCDTALQSVIYSIGDLSYTLYADSFSFMVDTIIGQMLSNKVADVLSARLLDICHGNVSPSSFEALSIADLRKIGLSSAKADYILGIAKHYRELPSFFKNLTFESDNDVIRELTKLRGIGSWSAKMYLIFVLDRPDVLPFEDGAFQQSFKWLYPGIELEKNAIQDKCSSWSPYSSIASRYLYKAVDSGLTKSPFCTVAKI